MDALRLSYSKSVSTICNPSHIEVHPPSNLFTLTEIENQNFPDFTDFIESKTTATKT